MNWNAPAASFIRWWWLLCISITCVNLEVLYNAHLYATISMFIRIQTLSIMHWTWKWQRQRFIVLFRFAVAMEWYVYLNNTDGHRTPDGHSDRQTDRQRRLSLRWMFTYFISVMDQKTSLKLKLYVCVSVHQFDLCERESDKWTRFRAYVRDFS